MFREIARDDLKKWYEQSGRCTKRGVDEDSEDLQFNISLDILRVFKQNVVNRNRRG